MKVSSVVTFLFAPFVGVNMLSRLVVETIAKKGSGKMKKFFVSRFSFVVVAMMVFCGCEDILYKDHWVYVVNAGECQYITVLLNGSGVSNDGKVLFGPGEVCRVRLEGDSDNVQNVITVDIYDTYGYFLDVESQTFWNYPSDQETREQYLIGNHNPRCW